MSEIRPGKCPVIDGIPQCPPPTEIDCIKVNKVMQECKEADVEKIIFALQEPIPRNFVDRIDCVSAKIVSDIVCDIPKNGRVSVDFDLEVICKIVLTDTNCITLQKTVHVYKSVRLWRAGEPGLKCEVDIPLVACLECFISKVEEGCVTEITCCVGKLFLFKLISEVQLMIPTYGYCAEPPECQNGLGECPDFDPPWPPYPPQYDIFGAKTSGGSGCGCGE